MQSNRLASLVKADAANTPGVIVIYGFYSNDLHDGLTDTKPRDRPVEDRRRIQGEVRRAEGQVPAGSYSLRAPVHVQVRCD